MRNQNYVYLNYFAKKKLNWLAIGQYWRKEGVW